MAALEPGEPIEIKYGKDKTIKAIGLSFRQQRKLAEAEDQLDEATTAVGKYDALALALKSALPHSEEDFEALLDSVNVSSMQIIIQALMGRLTEEEEKKFVLRLWSDADNSVGPADSPVAS